MKIATGSWRGRGKTERIQCPQCHAVYMQGAYIYVHEQGKRWWKRIGSYCNACGHYIAEET